MQKFLSPENRTALDVVNIVAGLGLALSPWYLGFTAESAATWDAAIVGLAVALIAAGTFFAFHQAEEIANFVLGLWAVIAPWALGYTAASAATLAHVVGGLVVAIVAAGSLWLSTRRPYSAA